MLSHSLASSYHLREALDRVWRMTTGSAIITVVSIRTVSRNYLSTCTFLITSNKKPAQFLTWKELKSDFPIGKSAIICFRFNFSSVFASTLQ